jgi:hypothetical protein
MSREDPIRKEVAARLERFLQQVERLSLEEMRALSARPAEASSHEQATLEAERVAIMSDRRKEIQKARRGIRDWVLGAQRPAAIGANVGIGFDQPVDRLEIALSLQDAATALMLWDLLPDGDRDELVGPWQSLAE